MEGVEVLIVAKRLVSEHRGADYKFEKDGSGLLKEVIEFPDPKKAVKIKYVRTRIAEELRQHGLFFHDRIWILLPEDAKLIDKFNEMITKAYDELGIPVKPIVAIRAFLPPEEVEKIVAAAWAYYYEEKERLERKAKNGKLKEAMRELAKLEDWRKHFIEALEGRA